MSETLERNFSHARSAESPATTESPAKPAPVTLIFSRHVCPDKVEQYEAWLHDIAELASQQVGYIGLTILRPKPGAVDPEYVTIAHFDTDKSLATWMSDPARVKLLSRADEFGGRPAEVVCEPGIDFWFTPDDLPTMPGGLAGASRPPPRWKMASVLTVLIFLLSQGLMYSLSPIIALGVPRPVVQFVALGMQISLLTYWMLPKLTHLLAFWLHPRTNVTL